jgi:cytochrome oxidase assembly protein ShyY1
VTFKGFLWQKERKQEKIKEISNRIDKIYKNSTIIKEIIPWKNLTEKEFKEKWEFRNIIVEGNYSDNQILISKTKDAQSGYIIISPFYSKEDSFKLNPILVDRGWVPKGDENLIDKEIINTQLIKGILHSGDKINKYTY